MRKHLLFIAVVLACLAPAFGADVENPVIGANPTATATGVAINGSSRNYMRADAAPAISSTTVAGVTCTPGSSCAISSATNSLSGDVALSNTGTYFDGPSTAQGTSGTWFAMGTVTVNDAVIANVNCKLWDGTNAAVASTNGPVYVGATSTAVPLSGIVVSPAGNIRISCKDITATTGKIVFNATGNSKDSTLTVIRLN